MRRLNEPRARRFAINLILIFIAFFLIPTQTIADENARKKLQDAVQKQWLEHLEKQRQAQDQRKYNRPADAGPLEYLTIGNCFTVQLKTKINHNDAVEQHACIDSSRLRMSPPPIAGQVFDLIAIENQYRFRISHEPALCLGVENNLLKPLNCEDRQTLWQIIRLPSTPGQSPARYQLRHGMTDQCVMQWTKGVNWSTLQMKQCFDLAAANLYLQAWQISRNGVPVSDLGAEIPASDRAIPVRSEPLDAIRAVRKELDRLGEEDKINESFLLGKLPELTQLAQQAAKGDTRSWWQFIEEFVRILRIYSWYGLQPEIERLVQYLVTIAEQFSPEDKKVIELNNASLYADTLTWLADMHQKLGRPERSVKLLERAAGLVDKFGVTGDREDPLKFNGLLAKALLEAGSVDMAETCLWNVLGLFRDAYDPSSTLSSLTLKEYTKAYNQVYNACTTYSRARTHSVSGLEEVLHRSNFFPSPLIYYSYANDLEVLGDVYAIKGQFKDAALLYESVADYFETTLKRPIIVARILIKRDVVINRKLLN